MVPSKITFANNFEEVINPRLGEVGFYGESLEESAGESAFRTLVRHKIGDASCLSTFLTCSIRISCGELTGVT